MRARLYRVHSSGHRSAALSSPVLTQRGPAVGAWCGFDLASAGRMPPCAAEVELEALVSWSAAGDEAAWRELWRRLEPRLWRLVRRRTFPGPPHRDDACR